MKTERTEKTQKTSKMKRIGKKQLVLAALVIALGSAILLNWQFSDNKSLLAASSKQNTTKELGKAQYANATATVKDSSDKDTDAAALLAESEKYFSEVQKSRDEAQQQVVDIATEILKSTESDDAARTEAVASAAKIANTIQKQTNIENLIKAKGFSECMVYLQDDSCNIVVNKGMLNEALAVAIRDIVCSQADIEFDKISIAEA
ncbi:MAG: SpoIIIAH-like family protein [Clostridiales bacterium]|nr:SpoIIIAH-like family protein [Clostridiales bacterium]